MAWIEFSTTVANFASDCYTKVTGAAAGGDAWTPHDNSYLVAKCPAAENECGIDLFVRFEGIESQHYANISMWDAWAAGTPPGSQTGKKCGHLTGSTYGLEVFSNPGLVSDTTVINCWMSVVKGSSVPAHIILAPEGDVAYSGQACLAWRGSFERFAGDTTAMGALNNRNLGLAKVYKRLLDSAYWDAYVFMVTKYWEGSHAMLQENPNPRDSKWWLWRVGMHDNSAGGDFRGFIPNIFGIGDQGWAHKDVLTDTGTSDDYLLWEDHEGKRWAILQT